MISEPKWKSLIAHTTAPIFTPEQCQNIIDMGHKQEAQKAKVGHCLLYTSDAADE